MLDDSAILTNFEYFLSYLWSYLISIEDINIRDIYIGDIIAFEYLRIYLQLFLISKVEPFIIS